MKKGNGTHPELNLYKKKIKESIVSITYRLNRIPKYIDTESEAYLMQLTRWILEDVENDLKEDIKRYYKLKQYDKK